MSGRLVLRGKRRGELLVQYDYGRMDMVYYTDTDLESRMTRKWLQELFRDIILRIAGAVLPEGVRYREGLKRCTGQG